MKIGAYCCLLFMAVILSAETASYRSADTAKETIRPVLQPGKNEQTIEDANGPTILLCSEAQNRVENPIDAFMYFVPAISPVPVCSQISLDNQQKAVIISCQRKCNSKSFSLSCQFKMEGEGSYKNTFDAKEMIRRSAKKLGRKKGLNNILDYVKFEGEGLGKIEVKGKIVGPAYTIAEVNIHFNNRGEKSPVVIGLYSLRPVDGEYRYESRYDKKIARINAISFKPEENKGTIVIKVGSLREEGAPEGILSDISGAIAGLFTESLEVDMFGRDTMLAFGLALCESKGRFTFPRACKPKGPLAFCSSGL